MVLYLLLKALKQETKKANCLQKDVATLTEGVWQISSFSRLNGDLHCAWPPVTVTGCHGRGSDKCLPGSMLACVCVSGVRLHMDASVGVCVDGGQ